MIIVQLKFSAESNNFSFWALWWQRTIDLCRGWTFHLTLKAVGALIDHAKKSCLSDRPSVQSANNFFAVCTILLLIVKIKKTVRCSLCSVTFHANARVVPSCFLLKQQSHAVGAVTPVSQACSKGTVWSHQFPLISGNKSETLRKWILGVFYCCVVPCLFKVDSPLMSAWLWHLQQF